AGKAAREGLLDVCVHVRRGARGRTGPSRAGAARDDRVHPASPDCRRVARRLISSLVPVCLSLGRPTHQGGVASVKPGTSGTTATFPRKSLRKTVRVQSGGR